MLQSVLQACELAILPAPGKPEWLGAGGQAELDPTLLACRGAVGSFKCKQSIARGLCVVTEPQRSGLHSTKCFDSDLSRML